MLIQTAWTAVLSLSEPRVIQAVGRDRGPGRRRTAPTPQHPLCGSAPLILSIPSMSHRDEGADHDAWRVEYPFQENLLEWKDSIGSLMPYYYQVGAPGLHDLVTHACAACPMRWACMPRPAVSLTEGPSLIQSSIHSIRSHNPHANPSNPHPAQLMCSLLTRVLPS